MKKIVFIPFLLLTGMFISVTAQEVEPAIYEKESKFNFEETIAKIRESAKSAGWTIPVEHDIQATLIESGEEVLPATIVVLCKESIATRVLGIEEANDVLALMPCRIAVYEKSNGQIYLAWANLKKAKLEVGAPKSTILNDVAEELKDIADNVVAK